jgi:hypothetical protein
MDNWAFMDSGIEEFEFVSLPYLIPIMAKPYRHQDTEVQKKIINQRRAFAAIFPARPGYWITFPE